MNRRNIIAVFMLISGALCSFTAAAIDNSSPLGIDFFPYVQFPNSEYSVNGLRLSIVGLNRDARGLDIGLLGNITKQTFKGIAIAGLFNYNQTTATITGLQISALANVNMAASSLYGIQIGVYNRVARVYGLQVGLINVAHELHGIQIGLINFNEAGPFTASPILNAAF